jgi:hypothetical protein
MMMTMQSVTGWFTLGWRLNGEMKEVSGIHGRKRAAGFAMVREGSHSKWDLT